MGVDRPVPAVAPGVQRAGTRAGESPAPVSGRAGPGRCDRRTGKIGHSTEGLSVSERAQRDAWRDRRCKGAVRVVAGQAERFQGRRIRGNKIDPSTGVGMPEPDRSAYVQGLIMTYRALRRGRTAAGDMMRCDRRCGGKVPCRARDLTANSPERSTVAVRADRIQRYRCSAVPVRIGWSMACGRRASSGRSSIAPLPGRIRRIEMDGTGGNPFRNDPPVEMGWIAIKVEMTFDAGDSPRCDMGDVLPVCTAPVRAERVRANRTCRISVWSRRS